MSDKRAWTEEEDRLLKFVFETSKLAKWSQIARRLQDEFGVKGRNGKQCKERYTTHIDTSHPKEEWGYEEEQTMFELHNQLGNKWAIIGSKLGGKSDNCVKNHFYSLLRKALRKLNRIIQEHYRREIKEIKPNVLYRIVEVSEERFKLNVNFDKEFVCFSNQLKNQLLEYSYDDEDMEEEENEPQGNTEAGKLLIDKIGQFGLNYKKKTKKERRSSGNEQDLLTPTRYNNGQKKFHSENDDSDHSSSFVNSEDLGNSDIIEDDMLRNSPNPKKSRRNSADTSGDTLEPPGRIRTRACSQDKIKKPSSSSMMKDEKDEIREKEREDNDLEVEQILGGLQLLEEDDNLPPHPLMMKKDTSKYDRYSQSVVEREEYHFFEESQIEMRILPEMQMSMGHRDSQVEENIFP